MDAATKHDLPPAELAEAIADMKKAEEEQKAKKDQDETEAAAKAAAVATLQAAMKGNEQPASLMDDVLGSGDRHLLAAVGAAAGDSAPALAAGARQARKRQAADENDDDERSERDEPLLQFLQQTHRPPADQLQQLQQGTEDDDLPQFMSNTSSGKTEKTANSAKKPRRSEASGSATPVGPPPTAMQAMERMEEKRAKEEEANRNADREWEREKFAKQVELDDKKYERDQAMQQQARDHHIAMVGAITQGLAQIVSASIAAFRQPSAMVAAVPMPASSPAPLATSAAVTVSAEEMQQFIAFKRQQQEAARSATIEE